MPNGHMRSSENTAAENQRRAGRLRAEGVQTSLGQMIDLSGSGTRIRCGRIFPPEGELVECRVSGPEGDFILRARVARARRLGLFVTEIGLEFVDLSSQQRQCLSRLASFLGPTTPTVQIRASVSVSAAMHQPSSEITKTPRAGRGIPGR